ncbi:hypothetical protein MSAN_02422300 [Mycena sanguinolenta]|uniref:Uncharacterized protein n=1 Tax=Mycena sanguinolenta TaxID=230812 RepID=A0A8H6X2T6_9AGAR|nr:hypothetical protein MSAN_02422300 [Mycena sanguinolenta]
MGFKTFNESAQRRHPTHNSMAVQHPRWFIIASAKYWQGTSPNRLLLLACNAGPDCLRLVFTRPEISLEDVNLFEWRRRKDMLPSSLGAILRIFTSWSFLEAQHGLHAGLGCALLPYIVLEAVAFSHSHSMPPLTRQRTPDSILSWWSDSNLVGPNINLHAAAKPLMRFLYHRAVLDFIARPRDVLTRDDMEIYCSYLAYKYVASETKCVILVELVKRAQSHADAPTIADSIVSLAPELLASAQKDIQRLTCWVFGALAYQDRTETALLTYARLAPCLHDSDKDFETVLALVRSRLALFPEPETVQPTSDEKVVEVLKGFGRAVCLVLVACQELNAIALAEEVLDMAIAVAEHVDKYKEEIAMDTDLFEPISNLHLELNNVYWLLQGYARKEFAWSSRRYVEEFRIQRLRRDITHVLRVSSFKLRWANSDPLGLLTRPESHRWRQRTPASRDRD